jgi:hypothetical protein
VAADHVSAVVVFIASSRLDGATPSLDWKRMTRRRCRPSLRQGWEGGQYVFPHAGNPPKRDEAWQRKCKEGPAGMLILFPKGGANMGKSLALWFVQCLVLGLFVAYLTGLTVPAGAPYLRVFRIAGTAAVLAWAGALPGSAIWFGALVEHAQKVLDGVVYGLLVAASWWLCQALITESAVIADSAPGAVDRYGATGGAVPRRRARVWRISPCSLSTRTKPPHRRGGLSRGW